MTSCHCTSAISLLTAVHRREVVLVASSREKGPKILQFTLVGVAAGFIQGREEGRDIPLN